jgi:hypothetical protein
VSQLTITFSGDAAAVLAFFGIRERDPRKVWDEFAKAVKPARPPADWDGDRFPKDDYGEWKPDGDTAELPCHDCGAIKTCRKARPDGKPVDWYCRFCARDLKAVVV